MELFVYGESIFSTEGTTQGDPMGVLMYALGVMPLIHKLNSRSITLIWYSDDACACSSLQDLHQWWDDLLSLGPNCGYYINTSKCFLLLKNNSHVFNILVLMMDTNTGSAIGTDDFTRCFLLNVQTWRDELILLSDIARTPAFSFYIHGFENKWMFLCLTTHSISYLF